MSQLSPAPAGALSGSTYTPNQLILKTKEGDEAPQVTCLQKIVMSAALGFLGGAAMGLFVGSQEVMAFPEGTSTKQKIVMSVKQMSNQTVGTAKMLGVFGFWFTTFQCGAEKYRGKDDIWNHLSSGFITGALLARKQGASAMISGGAFCAVMTGAVELYMHHDRESEK